MPAASEIKGVWLVTARTWVLEHHSREMLAAIASHVDETERSAITDPLPSEWYPEQVLQQALRGLRAEAAGGSNERFLEIMRQCTRLGVSHFFRVLLRLSSPSFVLRQVPTMWRQIRRGPARVEVTSEPDVITVRYRKFPFFDDENYRLLTLGSLTAVVELCTSERPRVTLGEHGADWLDVVIASDPA